MSSSKYLPAIDGLRALAVGAVIAFHFKVPFLDGGFVGVDLFFVISGFVIFRSIVREWETTGAFSWRSFSLRRVRRLAPASLFMAAVTLLGGLAILDPVDLKLLGESSVWHLFCASNFFFANNLGYFSGASELYPLLHTWSLSVEEQFYLVVPFVVLLVSRFRKGSQRLKSLRTVTIWIAIVSFILCVILCNNLPTYGFFISPTRAWEFCGGAILALYCHEKGEEFGGKGRWLFWGGLILVLVSFVFIKEAKYPKFQGLIPVAGSILLIAGLISVRSRLFSHPVMVWLGKLSYSLYLWHWPFLALKHHVIDSDSIVWSIALLLGGVVFALISYYAVELPLRFRLTKKASVRIVAAAWGALLLLSIIIWSGALGREVTSAELGYRQDVDWYGAEFRGLDVELGDTGEDVDFVLWGDSHSGMLTGVVNRLGKEYGLTGRGFVSDALIPVVGHSQLFPDKVSFNQASFARILELNPKVCFLVSSWEAYFDDEEGALRARELIDAMLVEMRKRDIEVVIARRVPFGGIDGDARSVLLAKRFPKLNSLDRFGMSRKEYEDGRLLESLMLNDLEDDIRVLDPLDVFFENEEDQVEIFSERAHYRDVEHLSYFGAERYMPKLLEPVFKDLAEEEQ